MNNIFYRVCFGLIIFLLFSGCTASSRSQRYKDTASSKEDTSKRFSKKAEEPKDIIAMPDTLDEDEFDEAPPQPAAFDKTKIVGNIEKLRTYKIAFTEREKVLFEVAKYLDTPYKYGGSSQSGIDCSAFTMHIYKNSLDLSLPRSTVEQYRLGDKISKDELHFGDLVFFNTRRRSNPGHVGIYLGENQFAHASRKLGVIVSSLDEAYYKKRYVGARRVDVVGDN